MRQLPKAILFDLDGTLFDTAPDLANALNHVLVTEQLEPLSFSAIRPSASDGSRGLLNLGFGITEHDAKFPELQRIFLDYYAKHLAEDTVLFPGMAELLENIEKQKIAWGVVTNKPAYLTHSLLEQFKLDHRAACIVSGDTLPQRKPHPAPLLHAAQLLNLAPEYCWYVGDAERDIVAGKNAGMHTMVALYGYIRDNIDPKQWAADVYLDSPHDLIEMLQKLRI